MTEGKTEIKFIASLKESGKCIKIDNDGCSEVVLNVPQSEIASVMRLVSLIGKAFEVKINT